MLLRNQEGQDGLAKALDKVLETIVPPGVRYEFSVTGDDSAVPLHVRNQFYLIMREAMRNAVTHSGAAHRSDPYDHPGGGLGGRRGRRGRFRRLAERARQRAPLHEGAGGDRGGDPEAPLGPRRGDEGPGLRPHKGGSRGGFAPGKP